MVIVCQYMLILGGKWVSIVMGVPQYVDGLFHGKPLKMNDLG